MNANAFNVRNLIYDNTKALPYDTRDGPNQSILLFYRMGRRLVIIQAGQHCGWELFVSSDTVRTDDSLSLLRSFLSGVKA